MSAVALKKGTVAPKKKVAATVDPPTKRQLDAVLGEAAPVWPQIIATMKERCAPFEVEWRPATKIAFDRYCILRRKDRRLLYLIPKPGEIEAMVVLGERAFDLAMKSSLPAKFKKLAREAKNYAEGRFIRFPLAASDIQDIVRMVELKLAPK
jgi:hypothetical protein